MFSWLKGDPSKRIRKKLDEARQTAMHQQRNGDLRSYAETMAKVEEQKTSKLKERLTSYCKFCQRN